MARNLNINVGRALHILVQDALKVLKQCCRRIHKNTIARGINNARTLMQDTLVITQAELYKDTQGYRCKKPY